MNTSMKFAVAVVAILLGMSLTTTAQAQTKQPAQEVTTQTATTDNGRKAILKNNGTWEYAREDLSSPKLESTLSFDTGIVFRSGDTKPVARTTFYLLDNSLVETLTGYKNEKGEIVTNPRNIYIDYSSSSESRNIFDFLTERYNRIWEVLKPHVVQTITTDFGGKATFKQIPPGNYYLIGYTKMGENLMVWDVKMDLSPGNNSFTLDQNNAAYTE